MYCVNCGYEITNNTKFCAKCGAKIGVVAVTDKTPKTTAKHIETKRNNPVLELIIGGLIIFFITFLPIFQYTVYNHIEPFGVFDLVKIDSVGQSCVLFWIVTIVSVVGYVLTIRAKKFWLAFFASVLGGLVYFSFTSQLSNNIGLSMSSFGVLLSVLIVLMMVGSLFSALSKYLVNAIVFLKQKDHNKKNIK